MPFNPVAGANVPPVIQQAAGFGQFGVPGANVESGLRTAGSGVSMYVDSAHSGAIAVGDGTDPKAPLSTLAAALTNLRNWKALGLNVEYSTIRISGPITESISILDYTLYPEHCSIIGAGPGPFCAIVG